MAGTIYTAQHRRLVTILRDLRSKRGITQAKLAAQLKRPQSYVSAYESGQRRLDLIEVERIAKALGTTLGAVVRRYESRG